MKITSNGFDEKGQKRATVNDDFCWMNDCHFGVRIFSNLELFFFFLLFSGEFFLVFFLFFSELDLRHEFGRNKVSRDRRDKRDSRHTEGAVEQSPTHWAGAMNHQPLFFRLSDTSKASTLPFVYCRPCLGVSMSSWEVHLYFHCKKRRQKRQRYTVKLSKTKW